MKKYFIALAFVVFAISPWASSAAVDFSIIVTDKTSNQAYLNKTISLKFIGNDYPIRLTEVGGVITGSIDFGLYPKCGETHYENISIVLNDNTIKNWYQIIWYHTGTDECLLYALDSFNMIISDNDTVTIPPLTYTRVPGEPSSMHIKQIIAK